MTTEERLSNIEQGQARVLTLLEGLSEKMETRIASSDVWRARTERTLYGDGNGHPGHTLRIDRLEQTGERQRWLSRTMLGAVVALAIRAVWDMLGKG